MKGKEEKFLMSVIAYVRKKKMDGVGCDFLNTN